MTYLVIGGAGAMGRITVRDLLETTRDASRIVVADYNLRAARGLVSRLASPRLKAIRMDVRDEEQAAKCLRGAAVAINSTHYHFNLGVMQAALKAGVHYIDLGGLFHVTRKQLKLHAAFRAAGLSAIIGMGAAPGITNLLAKRAADRLDSVHAIHLRVGSIDRTRYEFKPVLSVSYSIKTILEELSLPPAIFSRGRIRFVRPMSGAVPHRFPAPVGKQVPMHTIHSELATLPGSFKSKGIQEASFKIAFEPDFIERLKVIQDLGLVSEEAIQIQGQKVVPFEVVNAVLMSQSTPKMIGRLKQYEVVRAVVKGKADGKKVTHILDCHSRGMPEWGIGLDMDTGAPPSIVAQMLAQGKITLRGVLPPEAAVPQECFFKELQKRNIRMTQIVQSGWRFKV
jgi:lysine 6-dehydrogenase